MLLKRERVHGLRGSLWGDLPHRVKRLHQGVQIEQGLPGAAGVESECETGAKGSVGHPVGDEAAPFRQLHADVPLAAPDFLADQRQVLTIEWVERIYHLHRAGIAGII